MKWMSMELSTRGQRAVWVLGWVLGFAVAGSAQEKSRAAATEKLP